MDKAQADALAAVRTRSGLADALARLAGRWDFDTFSASVIIDRMDGTTNISLIDNTPSAYRSVFVDRDSGRCDPVMQHCKRSSVPVLWDQDSYVDRGAAAKWEVQAEHGYRHAVAMGMHLPHGEHFFLGFDRSTALPSDARRRSRLLADFSLLVVQCQVAASVTLCASAEERAASEHLTPREREVLGWTLAGKTAWEVGRLLSISERTAAIHANRAAHKLSCVSKHQAALKASRLGLI